MVQLCAHLIDKLYLGVPKYWVVRRMLWIFPPADRHMGRFYRMGILKAKQASLPLTRILLHKNRMLRLRNITTRWPYLVK